MILKKRQVIISLTIILVACIFLINGVYALDATLNASIAEANAAACINFSKQTEQAMINDGFNILSINDTINQAESAFLTQTLLKEKKDNYDFSAVLPYCETITKIRDDALTAKDEVNSLIMFYNESIISGMNTSTIDAMISDVNQAIAAERYTEVSALVDKTYTEITTVRSSYTALNVFYKSTARGVMAFLTAKNSILQIENWQFLSGLIILIMLLLFVYRIQIRKMRLRKKLDKLINRKKTIKDLIMKTQKDYFQYGKIPEGEYNIKTKRFAELIRDIDRQIPLLQEEIAKISGGTRNLFKEDNEAVSKNQKEIRKEKREETKLRAKITAHKSAHKNTVHKKPEKPKIKTHPKQQKKIIKAVKAKKRR